MAEWELESNSWLPQTLAGAYASPLKLPVAGYRGYYDGTLRAEGQYGDYWSSTVQDENRRGVKIISFDSNGVLPYNTVRARGHSVRCIKD